MLSAYYISNCLESNINDIKIASLYFDKIVIVKNKMYKVAIKEKDTSIKSRARGTITEIIDLVTQEFADHISVVLNEGIAEIVDEGRIKNNSVWEDLYEITNKILSQNINILFEQKNFIRDPKGKRNSATIKFTDETRDVHAQFINPFRVGARVNFEFILNYYSLLLMSLLKAISGGQQCLTSSQALNRFVRLYFNDKKIKRLQQELAENHSVFPQLAFEAIKLSVPNITSFPFEEVLEVREKSTSELIRFRNELELVQFDLQKNFDLDYIAAHSEQLVNCKIKPAVADLSKKIQSLKLRLPKKILDEVKNPASYAPLIGTFFDAIPGHIAALISLGLISLSTAYDYIISIKEIKNSGLYYLIKLNKDFRKPTIS